MTVIVGVDGSGRSHRLGELAARGGRPVVRVDNPAEPPGQLSGRLAAAAADGAVVLVDDAHRLPGELLAVVARAARSGLATVVARRPSITASALADLDEAASADAVERLEPLDEAGVAAVIRQATGRPATQEQAAGVRAATGGLPALVALVARAEPSGGAVNDAFTAPSAVKASFTAHAPPPALVARVQRQLTRLEPHAGEIARVLALGLELPDEVLAAATGVDAGAVARALRELHDAGLHAVDQPAGGLIPVVAAAVRADIPPAELRRLQDAVGQGLLAAGGDPVAAAEQLSAAGVNAPEAFLAAADRLRFADPESAVAWFDRAVAGGADPSAVAPGRAEAAALLGMPVDLDIDADDPAGRQRLALVHGAVAAHQGRPARAAAGLLAAASPGPLLAVPALVGAGRMTDARAAAATDGPPSLRLFAVVTLAIADPVAALPGLIEAAEVAEHAARDVVLPDTPHAVGAVVAVTAGDAGTAERLLQRGIATGVGGPAAVLRHRLLLAWVRLRSGRLDTATAELPKLQRLELGGRERTLAAAVSAGLARRTGDVARQRAAWAEAEPVLARQAFDLLQLEPLEELLVAAARVREHERVAGTLAQLDEMLRGWHTRDELDQSGVWDVERPQSGIGDIPAPAWAAALGWIRVQVAVVAEDAVGAAAAAEQLAALEPSGRRARAQVIAAKQWSRVLAGDVDPDAVQSAAEALSAGQLPWEASRLTGNAAIRIGDPTVARSLLERARELAGGEVPGKPAGKGPARGQLSEREVEVAQLVLAGRTHREIGAQLYVSPKTVEHHVARIRAKLGATSRAELQAALRSVLADEPD